MKNILFLLITFISFLSYSQSSIYFDDNGVTIKCNDDLEVGYSGELNGNTYLVVDEEMLKKKIENNEDLSFVCTSKISNMSGMFMYNSIVGDISHFDVSNVKSMDLTFCFTSFNGDISNWDVSNVTDMSGMFLLSKFNGDISNWDVSNVTDMTGMFIGSQFNGDISNWNVRNVTNMSGMFKTCNFNRDLSSWDVGNVIECINFSQGTSVWELPKPNFTYCDSKDTI